MFHLASDASRVAVVDLCHRLAEAGVVVIDTEQESDHMARLGQVDIDLDEYIDLVHRFRDQPVELSVERQPAARLLAR